MVSEKCALRVPCQKPDQETIERFEMSFVKELYQKNRWINRDANHGRLLLNDQKGLGTMILNHLFDLSDKETKGHIREKGCVRYNPLGSSAIS